MLRKTPGTIYQQLACIIFLINHYWCVSTAVECPNGTVHSENRCFYLTDAPDSVNKTRSVCLGDYGDLGQFVNIAEQSDLRREVFSFRGSAWIDGQQTSPGVWQTFNGDQLPKAGMLNYSVFHGIPVNGGLDNLIFDAANYQINLRSGTDSFKGLCMRPPFLHGGWTEWTGLLDCSSGRRCRQRTCTKPTPQYGGNDCVGPLEDYPTKAYHHFKALPTDDKRLDGYIIASFSGVTVTTCAMRCATTGTCASVNYHEGDRRCELSSATATIPALTSANGFQYIEMDKSEFFYT